DAMRPNTDRAARELQGYQDAAARLRGAGLPVTFAVNEQARQEYIDRRRRLEGQFGDAEAGISAQERLDRRLNVLQGFRPRNADEQSILDARILGIAGGFNPSELRGDQRNAIASAAERQAEREARQNDEALKSHRQREQYLKEIRDRIDGLSNAALSGGIRAVDAQITVRDETSEGIDVKTLRQPEPSDVALSYGTFGGGGGLTSF